MSTIYGLLLMVAMMLPGTPAHHATHTPASPHAAVASLPATMAALISAPVTHVRIAHACEHTVTAGEYLSEIAPGNWRQIAFANGISNPNLIFVGQSIDTCPNGAAQPAPASGTQYAVMQPATPNVLSGQPCQSSIMWPATPVYEWEIPVSCFGGVFYEGYGDCWGWVHHLVVNAGTLPAHGTPIPGAVAHFAGGVQGASWAGHWAYVLSTNGPWMLISEEANYWRGGFNLVTYRYALQSGGITYYY